MPVLLSFVGDANDVEFPEGTTFSTLRRFATNVTVQLSA